MRSISVSAGDPKGVLQLVEEVDQVFALCTSSEGETYDDDVDLVKDSEKEGGMVGGKQAARTPV